MTGLLIGIRYLTGYVTASDPSSRSHVEWPPHPARIFMAMVAASFENDESRDSLEWLQQQKPPLIYASGCNSRNFVTTYVPVNDKSGGRGVIQSAQGLSRTKQPRSFAKAWLINDMVFLHWPELQTAEHREELKRICSKVTRIGHSTSLVNLWLADDVPGELRNDCWIPCDAEADTYLRITSKGLLARLKEDYERNLRPSIGTWKGYKKVDKDGKKAATGTVWSPQLIIRRLEPMEKRHTSLSLSATLKITNTLHKAIVDRADGQLPEYVSGHTANKKPSQSPHLAFFPLAFVGSEYATGDIMGIAFAVPAALDRSQRLKSLAAVGRIEELTFGKLGKWKLAENDVSKYNLRAATWTSGRNGSLQWATVTPVAFDSHPKAKNRTEREEELKVMIKKCCVRIGLPEPVQTIITAVSAHLGAPPSHAFPRMTRKDGSERRHAHAIMIFDKPVSGPVAIGAGRYRGYGVCRPLKSSEVI